MNDFLSGFRMFGFSLPISAPKLAPRHILLIVILLAGAFLRFYRLDSIPPGLTHDEADTGYFVASVYRGEPANVQVPYGYAYKPFTKYSGALFMALFGPTDLALRIHSAFFGLLLVFFTYLWGREAFGATVGLGSAALIAVSFWPVCGSRFALNPAPAPVLFTA
ncbi:MAG: glycosyltransferase family 39 protein, partial [Anaerolineae bacterium]